MFTLNPNLILNNEMRGRERWVVVALSGEVEFEIVGDDCYYYAVVYAVCVFIFVVLLCLRSL